MLMFGPDGKSLPTPLLKIGDKLVDCALWELKTVLDALQMSVQVVDKPTAWDEGALETVEYLAGVAFVAAQKYMAETRYAMGAESMAVLKLGPLCRGGVSIAEAVHAAANQWKHAHEWDISKADRRRERTISSVYDSFNDGEAAYPLANLIFAMVGAIDFRLLASKMEEWRDAVLTEQSEAGG